MAATLLAALATGCGGHGRGPGTIVFASDRSGHEALYAVHPDGSGLRRLPRDLWTGNVAWKRDGTKALVQYESGRAYVLSVLSRTRRRIKLPGLSQLSQAGLNLGTDMPWSPEGTRLLLATDNGPVVLDLKTGTQHLIDASGADDLLAWSGDGKSILFTTGFTIYAAPADGGPARQVVQLIRPGVVALYGVQSSSDGKWMSFFANGELPTTRGAGLYTVRPDGTALHLISREAESSAWSPTSERLVFADFNGIVLVDAERGARRRLTNERLDDPINEGPAWSPDGRRILYRRTESGYELELWTMKADGTDRRSVTFPVDSGDGAAVWVESTLKGTPAPGLTVVSLPAAGTITTGLPIVALAAEGERAAVAQGFGNAADFGDTGGRVGPIVVWNPRRRTTAFVPVRGCGSASTVFLAADRVGYDCDNSSEGYTFRHALRLGSAELVRANGGEFSGAFLYGIVSDRETVAFSRVSQTIDTKRFRFHRTTRIWNSIGGRARVVRTFRGEVELLSLDDGRFAVLPLPCGTTRYCGSGTTVSVFSAGGRIRTFALDGRPVLDAALDGPRLVVLQRKRLTVIDLGTGHRLAAWPVRRGFGPAPNLQDAQGGLVAYVVGIAIHILRLSDGREIVIDTPNPSEPALARFVPRGLYYSFNESYASRPGRLVFVTRSELELALSATAAAP